MSFVKIGECSRKLQPGAHEWPLVQGVPKNMPHFVLAYFLAYNPPKIKCKDNFKQPCSCRF